jgi:Flp pilus assembly protein TadB
MTPFESSVRIGDAERDATVELLTRHFADGRLTKLEHEERTATALSATSQTELDALLSDLPDLGARRDGLRRRARRHAPGFRFRLLPLVLLAVVLVAALHVLPVLALAAVFFLAARLLVGRGRGWHACVRRPAERW